MLSNFDSTKFKEGTDIKRAVNVIIWTMEGFAAKKKEEIRESPITDLDFDEILLELDIYFKLLKDCFYKLKGGIWYGKYGQKF